MVVLWEQVDKYVCIGMSRDASSVQEVEGWTQTTSLRDATGYWMRIAQVIRIELEQFEK